MSLKNSEQLTVRSCSFRLILAEISEYCRHFYRHSCEEGLQVNDDADRGRGA